MNDFSKVRLSPGLKYTLRSMSRGKDHTTPITNFCNIPKFTITVDSESNCILCGCDGWLPIPVGKVQDFNSIEEVFDSPVAKMLQDDIDQKKFTWCAVKQCGILYGNKNPTDYSLNINIDNSCNLACPSCRRDIIMISSGPEYEQKILDLNRILLWLNDFDKPITIGLGGSGDALASLIIRNFIKTYDYKPNHKFSIATNGLLLKKVLENSKMKDAISQYSVSVDAGTAKTYENVRRPGRWSILLENLLWLAENKEKASVNLNFVIQRDNYRDLPAFVELCEKFNFIGKIQPLNDWGTWNSKPVVNPDAYTIVNGTYLDHDVANPGHPDYDDFIQILSSIKNSDHKFLHIAPYFNQYL
jgi:hypothetical protein